MSNNKTPEPDASLPWWHPDAFETRADALVCRAGAVKSLRDFFDRRGYVEVETPALQISPGMEPHLMAFETSLHDIAGLSPYVAGIRDEEAARRRHAANFSARPRVP